MRRGEILYSIACEECHALTDRTDLDARIKAKLLDVGTDPTMAVNYMERNLGKDALATGPLENKWKLLLPSERFDARAPGLEIQANLIFGTFNGRDMHSPSGTMSAPSEAAVTESAAEFSQLSTAARRMVAAMQEAKFAYKARPLNGIWATAPFLHNGSVPSLWELLKDPADRVAQFRVGSRDFDEQNVGLDIKGGTFVFDTARPGNSNKGHAFGTGLTEEQKRALLEFLKKL